MYIDHITIRTNRLAETKDFFLKIFDNIVEKERPISIRRIKGHWLYSEGKPIIHLIESYKDGIDSPTEDYDHVGFRLIGWEAFIEKLRNLKIPYSTMDLPEIQERRVFFKTPTDLIIEAVFSENETIQ